MTYRRVVAPVVTLTRACFPSGRVAVGIAPIAALVIVIVLALSAKAHSQAKRERDDKQYRAARPPVGGVPIGIDCS